MIKYDYRILKMFISLYGGIVKTAEAAGMHVSVLKQCLNGDKAFKAVDRDNLIRALAIPEYCIQAAFFTRAAE